MTNKDLLEDARRKQQALAGAGATATLRRLEYACALREVSEHRAFAEEGFSSFSAWAEKALGLQRLQANAYLAAALVPTELLQGRDFSLDALALLGRVSQGPKVQKELAAGIHRVGLAAARRVWKQLRDGLRGAEDEERVLVRLRSGLATAAKLASRREAKQQRSSFQRAVRIVMDGVKRHSTGDALAPDEQRMVVALYGVVGTSTLIGGGSDGPLSGDEKPNDFRNEADFRGEKSKSIPHRNKKTVPLPDDEGSDDDDDSHRMHRLADDDDDDPVGRRLDDDAADELLLPVDAAVAALMAGSDGNRAQRSGAPSIHEGRRAWLSGALASLLFEGSPDTIARGQETLQRLAAEAYAAPTGEPDGGPDVGPLRAWVARATDEDIERRFPLVFPALLHVDHPQLPRALWSLCSARLPPRLLKQVTDASAARRWPPLPPPGDAAGLAALKAAADAAVEHFKALEPRR